MFQKIDLFPGSSICRHEEIIKTFPLPITTLVLALSLALATLVFLASCHG